MCDADANLGSEAVCKSGVLSLSTKTLSNQIIIALPLDTSFQKSIVLYLLIATTKLLSAQIGVNSRRADLLNTQGIIGDVIDFQ